MQLEVRSMRMPGGWPGRQRHVNSEWEAETLKKEGNALFGKGKYSAAIEVGCVHRGDEMERQVLFGKGKQAAVTGVGLGHREP